MTKQVFITSLTKILTLSLIILSCGFAKAQIIGPSVKEVKFSYTTTFEIPVSADESTDEDRAHFHASHLFGLFNSPEMVAQFSLPRSLGGIGAPRSQMKIKILSSEVDGDLIRIKYSNSGKMILHDLVAKVLLKKGQFDVLLPVNPYTIYDEKCTDEHYNSFGDYWYFYDIFKKGCRYLSKPPYAEKVTLTIRSTDYAKMQMSAQLPQLRGNNGNGDLFSIYVIHGYESDSKDKQDSGRQNFDEFNTYLRENNFTEDKLKSARHSALIVYTKDIVLANGQEIKVEVKHLLVTTGIESRSKVFAMFFKEAVENADVIVYGGHSGLGGNLDIPSLEEKAGKFKFNPKKKQIFFFDSCSSYSYYLQDFTVEKTKAKIDVITNGLSSYFNMSNGILTALMDRLLSENSDDVDWADILQDMENTLNGDTYLLNVGGV